MAHFQRDKTTDEFGNPIRPSHEDPVHHGTTGTGSHGTAGTSYGTTTGGVTSVPLHRRSDSSSSSEDDGYGGRRMKKGLKEKINEKLPGGTHKSDDPDRGTSTTTPYGGGQHEEKGMMDKIKEKLPGHH